MPLLPFGCTGVWAVGHNSLTNGLRCQFEQEGTGEDPGARVFWGKPRPHSSNRAGSYSRNSSPTRCRLRTVWVVAAHTRAARDL